MKGGYGVIAIRQNIPDDATHQVEYIIRQVDKKIEVGKSTVLTKSEPNFTRSADSTRTFDNLKDLKDHNALPALAIQRVKISSDFTDRVSDI